MSKVKVCEFYLLCGTMQCTLYLVSGRSRDASILIHQRARCAISRKFLALVLVADPSASTSVLFSVLTFLRVCFSGLIKLKDLLRVPALRAEEEMIKMSVRQHKPDQQSYKKLFKDITKRGETNIVLSIPVDKVYETLRQAQEVGMMTDYHNYLIANLVSSTLSCANTKVLAKQAVCKFRNFGEVISEQKQRCFSFPVAATDTALSVSGVCLSFALHALHGTWCIVNTCIQCISSANHSLCAEIAVV